MENNTNPTPHQRGVNPEIELTFVGRPRRVVRTYTRYLNFFANGQISASYTSLEGAQQAAKLYHEWIPVKIGQVITFSCEVEE